ncbi:MAG: LacI family DNA-binding transcriptional regulator [Anaerolineae bacterium]|nr:LacI family DNA-binding transcriptional regulator [Anaerolineae bacterium]
MTTIRDVAKRAKVSASTASRILSNSTKEKYSEETRSRVISASIELGYRPNFAARALVSGETRIIAAIFPRIYDTPFTALASLQILSGIEAYCSDNGYHMLISSPKVREGEIDPTFVSLLSGGYLDGAIIDGHFDISPIVDLIIQMNIPSVVLGHHAHTHYLRSDNFAGGQLMMQHLIDLGHRHIGLIAIRDIEQRLNGVKTAADENGLNFEILPLALGNFSEESGEKAAVELIKENPNLTAIVAFNDRMAMGAIKALQKLGYSVPDQISVIGYDNLPRSADFNPPLTTIDHQLSSWGKKAMNMLLGVMQGKEVESIVLTPKLIVRASTGALQQ